MELGIGMELWAANADVKLWSRCCMSIAKYGHTLCQRPQGHVQTLELLDYFMSVFVAFLYGRIYGVQPDIGGEQWMGNIIADVFVSTFFSHSI